MQNIRDFNLLSLVPPSLSSDPQVKAACTALQEELQAVSKVIDQIMIISKIDQQPSEVIDNLAWQWHVDFYDDSLPLETRIALVKNSIPWHRIKGTVAVVQEMVSTVLSNGVVTEWFQYGGAPYRFRIQTDEIISDEDAYTRLVNVVNAVKNVRSWLDMILINRSVPDQLYFGAALYSSKNITINHA